MPETRIERSPNRELRQRQLWLPTQTTAKVELDWRWGLYYIKNLTQDEVVIGVRGGKGVNTYRGRKLFAEDPQSDAADSQEEWSSENCIAAWIELLHRATGTQNAQSEPRSAINAIAWVDVEHTLLESQGSDRFAPELSAEESWTSDQLAHELLNCDPESDWSRHREIIFQSEDAAFSVEQSVRLAPRLLELAEQHRDSNDPQDAPVVLSAIRTGASMLRPTEAERLLPLLEPGHSIETSLVALKMLGRVFETQPPDDTDQYEALASEARSIAESLLNPYAIATSQSAAMAQLAVYALAAMGSSHLVTMTQTIRQLAVDWFTRRTVRKLRELDEFWQSQRCNVASAHRDLVSGALAELQN
ncbi:MAG: hypothetical protein IID34_15410 [Planctomycetes bacterium]|nr:hypothetical protein [Planctomycetota bacterium]